MELAVPFLDRASSRLDLHASPCLFLVEERAVYLGENVMVDDGTLLGLRK